MIEKQIGSDMRITSALYHAKRFVSAHAPLILSSAGSVGVIATAVLSSRATVKAVRIVDEEEMRAATKLSFWSKFKLTWSLYIPTFGMGSIAIASIIVGNRVETKRTAALAAAYSVSEKAFAQYREKIAERFGEKKERAVRDDIQQDLVRANPPSSNQVIALGGDSLFYESYVGRYFKSTMEDVRRAVNETNYIINSQGYASLSDFYDILGLGRTEMSEEFGWNSDKLMDVDFTSVLAEDGKPAVAMNYSVTPIGNYYRFR